MNLPTDLLRTFLTVVERGSITAAASRLGRSQPAVSLQIQRLESLLEQPLFHRHQRKLQLSEQGQMLFGYAEQMLSLNDELVSRLTRPHVSGHVHLGLPDEFALSFLPDLLRRYANAHPQVTLQVSCDLSVNLQKRLSQGAFDLVLALSDDPVHSAPTASQWREEVVWIGTESALLQRGEPLALIMAPEGCAYRRRLLSALNAHQRRWRLAYTSPNFSGIRAGVMAGLGITAVAQSTVTSGLKILGAESGLPALPPVTLSLFYHREQLGDAARRLLEHISEHMV